MTSGSATRVKKEQQKILDAVRAEQRRTDRRRIYLRRGAWIVSLLVLAGLVSAALLSSRAETVTDSKTAAPFTMPLSNGESASLADYAGEPVLLYFSSGAGCDSCITQMAGIEADPGFAEAGIAVLPIVMNTADEINAARVRFGVQAPFALDDGTVSEAYGVLGVGMHPGLPGHGFVLVDAEGIQRWSGVYPSMWLDPEELLGIVESELT
jgi:peroxiredoxin